MCVSCDHLKGFGTDWFMTRLVWIEAATITPARISDANTKAVEKRLFPAEVRA